MTYPKPPKTNLEDALDEIMVKTMGESGWNGSTKSYVYQEARTQITNLFVSQFLEAIGEDEPIKTAGDPKLIWLSRRNGVRNQLRAELRAQIKDTIGRRFKG